MWGTNFEARDFRSEHQSGFSIVRVSPLFPPKYRMLVMHQLLIWLWLPSLCLSPKPLLSESNYNLNLSRLVYHVGQTCVSRNVALLIGQIEFCALPLGLCRQNVLATTNVFFFSSSLFSLSALFTFLPDLRREKWGEPLPPSSLGWFFKFFADTFQLVLMEGWEECQACADMGPHQRQ